MMERRLKIMVELTIDNPSVLAIDHSYLSNIKLQVESGINGGAMPGFLHSLGNYVDAEVVRVKLEETHDTNY